LATRPAYRSVSAVCLP